MKKILYRTFIFSLLFPAYYLTGCMDTPNGFEAPQWDVNLTVPVMDTTYTLAEAIKKSDMIKSYPAGSPQANLLYYADNKKIEKVTVGNSLKIDQVVNSNAVENIGEVKIKDPAPSSASILSSSWTSLPQGVPIPLPQIPLVPNTPGQYIGIPFPEVSEFKYLVLSSGSLDLTLKNSVSAEITLSGCELYNTDNGTSVCSPFDVKISANGTANVNVPLNTGANKIYSKLSFRGTLTTPGSNGTPITIPQKSIDITAAFKNLAVNEVQGNIQVNTIDTQKSFELDSQTKFQTVVIDQGTMSLNLTNNIDVDLSATVTLLSLYSSPSAQQPYSLTLNVKGKSSTSQVLDLRNFVLRSGGDPTNLITYKVHVTTVAADNRTIKSTDNISESIQMSQLSLKSITGIVKPTTLDIKPSTVSIKLGEMRDKLKFSQLSFKDPSLKLYLKPSSNLKVKVKVDGTVKAKGYSSTLKFTDYISSLAGQVDSVVEVPSADLAKFLSSFTPSLPTELTISGTATVNPDAEQVVNSVAQSDSITGHAEISFPFNVGVSDGDFKDTTELKLKDNLKKEIDKINSIILTLQITNGLPASVKWTGSFQDSTLKIKLLDLPPNRQTGNNFILVPAASVDANGKVTAPSVKTETIEFSGSDVDKFINSKYLISNVLINTSGSTTGSASPVEFKITDSIRLKASAGVIYRVDLQSK